MKKTLSLLLALSLTALSGCVPLDSPPSSVSSDSPSQTVSAASSAQTSSSGGQSSNVPSSSDTVSWVEYNGGYYDFSIDPPLSKGALEYPLPDFLNKEQQQLYRRAMGTFFLFVGAAGDIVFYPPLPDEASSDLLEGDQNKLEIDGFTSIYYPVRGRYREWSDFEAMILSIYTEDYFTEINRTDNNPVFLDWNGITYGVDTGKGGNLEYVEPDTFELVEQSADKVVFNLICHYQPDLDYSKEMVEKAFPIEMVLTDGGWRVQKFKIGVYAQYH